MVGGESAISGRSGFQRGGWFPVCGGEQKGEGSIANRGSVINVRNSFQSEAGLLDTA